jgi:hypothetical protein
VGRRDRVRLAEETPDRSGLGKGEPHVLQHLVVGAGKVGARDGIEVHELKVRPHGGQRRGSTLPRSSIEEADVPVVVGLRKTTWGVHFGDHPCGL